MRPARTASADHTPSPLRGVQHYVFVGTALTFGAAKENCETLGSRLAEPKSEAEAISIATAAAGQKYWVGGRWKNDRWVWVGSGKTFWLSRTSNKPWSSSVPGMWTRWRNDSQVFPSPTGDCVRSSSGTVDKLLYHWESVACSSESASVCEVLAPKHPGRYVYTPGGASLDWAAAETKCAENGGQLANVYTAADADAIKLAVAENTEFWVGGKWSATRSAWTWGADSKYRFWLARASNSEAKRAPGAYTNWRASESRPTGNGECIRFSSGAATWEDHPCSSAFPFLCEQLAGAHRLNAEALASAVNASGWRDFESARERVLLRLMAQQAKSSYDFRIALQHVLKQLKIAHQTTLAQDRAEFALQLGAADHETRMARSATVAAARRLIHARSTSPSSQQRSLPDSSCDEKLEMLECAHEHEQVCCAKSVRIRES